MNRHSWKTVIAGVLIIGALSGCLSVQNVPADGASRPTDAETATTTEACPIVLQTDWISAEDVEQSNESVTSFEGLSDVHQKLFLRAYHNTSYEVRNVSESVIIELGDKLVRYKESTYEVHVIMC